MKKLIAIIMSIMMVCMSVSTVAYATNESPDAYYITDMSTELGGIQKIKYENDLGGQIIQYKNIDTYVNTMLSRRNANVSEYELAKDIFALVEGDVVDTVSEEYILEALKYQEVTQTISYIKVSEDGTQEYMSEEDMMAEINVQNGMEIMPLASEFGGEPGTTSTDGYMKLVNTAIRIPSPSYSVDSRNHYYIVSANAEWLKIPMMKLEDVLALSFGSAIFDDQYREYASVYEYVHCTECDTDANMSHYVYGGPTGPTYSSSDADDHVYFVYDIGSSGVACRVNFVEATGIGKSCSHDIGHDGEYDCMGVRDMVAYIRASCYSQGNDFAIHSGYAHKWVGGSISVSISAGVDSASGSIGFSGGIKTTEYFSRATTVTYISNP